MNNYYTDCQYCRSSFQVTKFVYDYLCNGGEGLVICDDCDREEALLDEAWA
jgi:hypothetical protein